MSATRTITPRTDGDPVPDVLGMALAHRVMLRDVDRLTELCRELAAGGPVPPKRATAVAAYVRDWADSVHHHHTVEDDVLWPVLEVSAGPHIDLTELSEDHDALDPLLDRLRSAADAYAARPAEDTASVLGHELARIGDMLREHIGDEEASVFPVIQRYVSVADWQHVEKTIQKSAKLGFEAPRVVAVMTPDEYATLIAEAPLPLRIVIKLVVPPYRRRERLVFGS